MLTTGSKYFFGTAVLGGLAVLLYSVSTGAKGDMVGLWVLVTFASAMVFMGVLMTVFRDADPTAAQLEVLTSAGDGVHPGGPRITAGPWPILGGFAGAVMALGLVLDERLFGLGVALAVFTALEWTVQGWADRASDDPAFNAVLRAKIMRPFEFPIFGLLSGVFVVIGFSRVLLAVSDHASIAVFAAVAFVVFVVAIGLSMNPGATRQLIPVVLVLGALGVIVGGVIAVDHGFRSFEHGEIEDGPGTVANKSNVFTTVTARGGKLAVGQELIVPKSTTLNVLFRNDNAGKRSLVIEGADGKPLFTTTPVEENKVTVLTFRLDRPGEYVLTTEGGSDHPEATITVQ